MTSIPQYQQIALGAILLLIDDEDFLHGYTNGYETFHVYHPNEERRVDTSTLLFLLKNGWNAGQTDQWNTGYIIGWLAALYEQEDGQFAFSTSISAPCEAEWEERESA